MSFDRSETLNEALVALHFAYRAVVEEPDRILAARGLSRVHHRVLFFVGRAPGQSVASLCARMEVSKQALHGPLKQLVEKKLVAMPASTSDRRRRELYLTAAGRALEERLSGLQRDRFARAFRVVGADGERAWHRVMNELATAR